MLLRQFAVAAIHDVRACVCVLAVDNPGTHSLFSLSLSSLSSSLFCQLKSRTSTYGHHFPTRAACTVSIQASAVFLPALDLGTLPVHPSSTPPPPSGLAATSSGSSTPARTTPALRSSFPCPVLPVRSSNKLCEDRPLPDSLIPSFFPLLDHSTAGFCGLDSRQSLILQHPGLPCQHLTSRGSRHNCLCPPLFVPSCLVLDRVQHRTRPHVHTHIRTIKPHDHNVCSTSPLKHDTHFIIPLPFTRTPALTSLDWLPFIPAIAYSFFTGTVWARRKSPNGQITTAFPRSTLLPLVPSSFPASLYAPVHAPYPRCKACSMSVAPAEPRPESRQPSSRRPCSTRRDLRSSSTPLTQKLDYAPAPSPC